MSECTSAIADGFNVVDMARPGVLLHKEGESIAPIEVGLSVWFYVCGMLVGGTDCEP